MRSVMVGVAGLAVLGMTATWAGAQTAFTLDDVSSYTLQSDGKQVARGINSIQAIKEAGGWRVTSIMVQAESVTAPLPKQYLP